MSDYNNNNDRAPATGIAGTVLGSVGTALGFGLFNGNGFLGLGGNVNNSQIAELQKQVQELSVNNAILTSETSTDKKLVEVFKASAAMDKELSAKIANLDSRVLSLETSAPLKEQIIDQKIARVADNMTCCCNAANTAIANLHATLAGITKTVVPNSSVCPGWGNVTITPAAATTATT